MKVKWIIGTALLLTLLCSFASQTVVFAVRPKAHPELKTAISFDHYHTYDEMVIMLEAMERRYHQLMSLYSIGESFLGKKIWAVEITNRLCGNPMSKPALLVAGAHHGDEVIGKEVVLYFIWYLLTNYRRDPKVTRILNTRTIYAIPLVNPDGNDLMLLEDQIQRWNVRPADEDGDGLFDEDPPEDINEDGKITEMRKWNATLGDYEYFWGEGIDNDGDGMINEDRIGGVDLNRNYGYAWQPFPWPGGEHLYGEYPFSEPETQAVRDFVLAHPNIATGFDTHSGAQCILYPWSHTFDPLPDADLYNSLGEEYSTMIDYVAGQTPYILYPCTGTTMDWAYGAQGLIHFTNEVFGPYYYDPEAPFDFTKFIQDYPDVECEWREFEHPQLGTVEIGGFWGFRFYNPPENEIEAVGLRNLPMILNLAEITPDIEITNVELEATTSRKYRNVDLSINLINTGSLDTATQQALQTGIAQPVTVSLELSRNAKLLAGVPTTSIEVLHGGQITEISWTIQVKVPSINWALITAQTSKGGVEKLLVTIIALPHKTLMFTKPLEP